MTIIPEDFTPDLRRLKSWPSMGDSPWRQPYLSDMTFGELHRLVDEFVISQGLSILDVGCGWGYLSLELAREGHDVQGIDSSKEMIEVARRTMSSDPYISERGKLNYSVTDFTEWREPENRFDLVIFSRVLHHLPQPRNALRKASDLLRAGGQVICVEYAYDIFDRRSARWLYSVRRALEQAGWYESEKKLTDDAIASTDQILAEWLEPARKEHFNRFEEMINPLRTLFHERHFSWKPYIYWDIIANMRIPSNDTERAVASSLAAMERAVISTGAINPVLFCFIGEKAAA